jgi:hypothetical protein
MEVGNFLILIAKASRQGKILLIADCGFRIEKENWNYFLKGP